MNRNARQATTLDWVRATFGEVATETPERIRRLLEEAVELAQAEGLTVEETRAVVEYVYQKSPGSPAQEVGGVGLTLLAYCQSKGLDADAEEQRELDRVLAVDPAHFRARHNKKADAGIAARVPES